MRLWFLILLVAAVILAILWIMEVIPGTEIGGIALKTFGALAVLLVASVAWRIVRGRSNVPDSTDQPVP
jgi:hypothetical protein